MPGIAGIISRLPSAACESELKAMLRAMEHEPFYASEAWSSPKGGLFAGCVALRDSFTEGRILRNKAGDVVLMFSGECFFDSQTGLELKRNGHDIGDHEASWLVPLYEERGEGFFKELNGIFSGLLVDLRLGKAFLFNDRYGLDRVYCHDTPEAFYFASEAKAILRVCPECRAFDADGLGQFLALGCTLDWLSLFRGVTVLPGGSLWTFGASNPERTRYFSPSEWESQPELPTEEFCVALDETLSRVTPRYFKSRQPLGVALTGGLDTRMIMACVESHGDAKVCYTFSGENAFSMDDRLAARVAKTCGLDHHLLRIGSDFFENFRTLADRTVYLTDGAFGVSGAHEIYMNAKARSLAPVRLTGNFGGEVLRGVSTFKPIGVSPGLFSEEACDWALKAAANLPGPKNHACTGSVFREIPWGLFGSLMAGRSQVNFRTPFLDNKLVALAFRAGPESRRTRDPGLRLVRNHHPGLASIPTDKGDLGNDAGLSSAARRLYSKITFKMDYMQNEGFPHWLCSFDGLIQRATTMAGWYGLHKHLHYRRWFQGPLRDHVLGVLTDRTVLENPIWSRPFLEATARDHRRGARNCSLDVNTVLTVEAIERLLFRGN